MLQNCQLIYASNLLWSTLLPGIGEFHNLHYNKSTKQSNCGEKIAYVSLNSETEVTIDGICKFMLGIAFLAFYCIFRDLFVDKAEKSMNE